MSKPCRSLSQAPPPWQAGPSGRRCGAARKPACPGSGPLPSASSLGPLPAPPPPQATPSMCRERRRRRPKPGRSPGPSVAALAQPSGPLLGPLACPARPSAAPAAPTRQGAADPRALGKNGVLQAGGTELATRGVSSVLAIHLGSISPALLFCLSQLLRCHTPQMALPSCIEWKSRVTSSRQDHRLRADLPSLPLSPAPSLRALRGFRCTVSFNEWKQGNEKYRDQLLVLDHIYGRVEVITVIYFVETFISHLVYFLTIGEPTWEK